MTTLPVAYGDIKAAAVRLRGHARRTPVLRSEALDAQAGARLLIKAAPMQRTGSFKFRGAFNAIASLRPPAVVAFSSGNHAQGVAAAAAILGMPATIIMPADAPRMKLENTRALGAEVITYDRSRESREAIAAEVAERRRAVLIRPYDEPLVIAGQGTVGLELAEEAEAQELKLDAALVCCGGGGLIAGCALALRQHFPDIAVHSVEPDGFDDTARSLAADRRLPNASGQTTICDALMAPMPGEITFEVNRRLLRSGVSVSDAEVESTMRLAFRHLKLVIEPGGAVALAAALFRKLPLEGTVGIVVSGGNVDPEAYARIIAAPDRA
jgi:threonine dehydratase